MYDVFCDALRSSGRALLSDGVKCYAFWIHNHSSSSFSLLIVGRHMWDCFFFCHANENFNIFYTQGMMLHDVFDHNMSHSSGLALLKDDEKRADFSCYRHSSSLFSLLIIMRHMRLVQFWCTTELSLYFQYQVWCVVYNLLLSSSGRAMLSEDEKCNTMSIHNHSSSMFPSSLVGSQFMGLVRFLHDVLKDNIYFWMCT